MRPLPILPLQLSSMLVLLAAASAASAAPKLVWSGQAPDDAAAVFHARGLDEPGAAGQSRALFAVPTAPGYTPHAALSGNGRWMAITTLAAGRHPERGGLLWRADLATGEVTQVARDVLYMERPVALDDGALLYMRVVRSLPAPPERTRQGELDAVETELLLLRPGAEPQRLLSDVGYGLHFAGIAGTELVLYRVAYEQTAFFLLPLPAGREDGAGKWHKLADAPTGPFARDFHLRGGELVFAATAERRPRATVFGLDLKSGKIRTLKEAENAYPSPLPAGKGLAMVEGANGRERLVLETDGKTRTLLAEGIPFPLHAGAGLLAVRRQTPVAQELWLLDLEDGHAPRLLTDRGFFSVAGIAELPGEAR